MSVSVFLEWSKSMQKQADFVNRVNAASNSIISSAKLYEALSFKVPKQFEIGSLDTSHMEVMKKMQEMFRRDAEKALKENSWIIYDWKKNLSIQNHINDYDHFEIFEQDQIREAERETVELPHDLSAEVAKTAEALNDAQPFEARLILNNFLRRLFHSPMAQNVSAGVLSSIIFWLIQLCFQNPAPATNLVINNYPQALRNECPIFLTNISKAVRTQARHTASCIEHVPMDTKVSILKAGRVWAKVYYETPDGCEGYGFITVDNLTEF